MPSVAVKKDNSNGVVDVRYLRFYYPLASLEELYSELGNTWYTSCLKRFSHQTHSHKQYKIHYNFSVGLYKRQLLEDLTKRGISFDDYRAGRTYDIDMIELKARFNIPFDRNINIHECDFIYFQLQHLKVLEPYITEPFPYVYQFYSITERTEEFSKFIADFKRQLHQWLRNEAQQLISGHQSELLIPKRGILAPEPNVYAKRSTIPDSRFQYELVFK